MRRRVGGVDIDMVASEAVPPDGYILVTGKLSLGGQAELIRRVRAGENETKVLAELLVKEGKAVAGRIG